MDEHVEQLQEYADRLALPGSFFLRHGAPWTKTGKETGKQVGGGRENDGKTERRFSIITAGPAIAEGAFKVSGAPKSGMAGRIVVNFSDENSTT